jgi:2-keto-4-pentenoate hydratase/2-oxohepta-3-ene-1,7-dioic acid hydratase in catechol pathway
MKIICIGRNYTQHIKELNNDVPEEPVFFMKPDSSLLIKNRPFFIPDFSNEIHYEVELVLKINRIGKNIDKKFAHRYYEEIGLGVDFTARDIQAQCKKRGLPWEKAKSFDASAVLGDFAPKDALPETDNIGFSLHKNGEKVQEGNSADMIFSFDEIIAYLSKFVTFKMGDLIYTGTPAGVGQVKIGDRLEGYIGQQKMFDFMVK